MKGGGESGDLPWMVRRSSEALGAALGSLTGICPGILAETKWLSVGDPSSLSEPHTAKKKEREDSGQGEHTDKPRIASFHI